jgi:hypothetical protein
VADYVFNNREFSTGISFVSPSSDLAYPQAPFVEILTEEEIDERYGSDPENHTKATEYLRVWTELANEWRQRGGIDWTEFRTTQNDEGGTEIVACAGGSCSF